MSKYPSHLESITDLKRVEGQLRGIQKMINQQKYCVDILNQVHAAINALARVEDQILDKHFANCVSNAVCGRSASTRSKKMNEILMLVKQFRKL